MKKDYRFQILYALGIIFIVAGHGGGAAVNLFSDWFPFSSFHLGLFMFISGYFYKKDSEQTINKFIIKKVKKLLVPLLLWNIFYAIVVKLLSYGGFTIGVNYKNLIDNLIILPIKTGHQFGYNLGGWFVIPLLMIQIYNVLIRKVINKNCKKFNEWTYFLLNLCLGIIGVYMASRGYNHEWWLVLVRMLYFIPFYSFGILYKNILEKFDTISSTKYFTIIFIINMMILIINGYYPGYTPSWCNDFVNGPILPFIVGFVGIAFWLRIAKLLEPIIGKNKYLNLIADNTYTIMINHILGFMILKAIFGILSLCLPIFGNFDWLQFKTNIWYLFIPKNIAKMKILYLIMGIAFPILLQLFINKYVIYIKEKYKK